MHPAEARVLAGPELGAVYRLRRGEEQREPCVRHTAPTACRVAETSFRAAAVCSLRRQHRDCRRRRSAARRLLVPASSLCCTAIPANTTWSSAELDEPSVLAHTSMYTKLARTYPRPRGFGPEPLLARSIAPRRLSIIFPQLGVCVETGAYGLLCVCREGSPTPTSAWDNANPLALRRVSCTQTQKTHQPPWEQQKHARRRRRSARAARAPCSRTC